MPEIRIEFLFFMFMPHVELTAAPAIGTGLFGHRRIAPDNWLNHLLNVGAGCQITNALPDDVQEVL